MRARSMGLTAMLTVAAGAAVLWAAPPVKNLAATAMFRNADGDAVKSSPLIGAINSIGAFTASVASPPDSGTEVTLPDYLAPPDHPEDTRECAVPGVLAGCNPDGPLSGSVALEKFQVGVKPILGEADEYQDRPGGLTGMACFSSSDALVNYTLYILNSVEGHWGLNANPRYHADAATVVRTSGTTWVVTAVGRAELISFGHSGIARKGKGPSHEGQYILPFQITIFAANAPNCP